MQRLLLVFAAALTFSVAATEKNAISELNQTIDRILAEFRSPISDAQLRFDELSTDETRALELKVSGLFRVTGPENSVAIVLDNLHYKYDSVRPHVDLEGSIGVDLTKVFAQEQLNQIIPDVDSFIGDFAKSFSVDYGDAVQVAVKVSDKKQDERGNYVAISGDIEVNVDLSKLPAEKAREDVIFTAANLHLDVDLKKGANVRIALDMNPEFRVFQQDQKGMKEWIDALLKREPNAMESIRRLFNDLERFSFEIATRKAN